MKNMILIFLLGLSFMACTSDENKMKTIYFVRHAEKDTLIKNDPALTVDGVIRSVDLATWFKKIEVDTILSSDYRRTRETAEPLAEAQGLKVGIYNPSEYEVFGTKLIEMKADTIVVIGHSNTVLAQIEALGIKKPQSKIEEHEYDKIFEVKLSAKNAVVHQYGSMFNK